MQGTKRIPTRDIETVVSSMTLKDNSKSATTKDNLEAWRYPKDVIQFCTDNGIKTLKIESPEGTLTFTSKDSLKERAKERTKE
jgi:hypothetical protein